MDEIFFWPVRWGFVGCVLRIDLENQQY